MNRKHSLFLLVPAFFTLLSVTSVNEFASAYSITNEQKQNIINNLNSSLRIESNVTSSILGNYIVINEVDNNNFYIEYYTNNQLSAKQSIVKDGEGNALEQYLTLTNEVATREILDANSEPVKFSSNFPSLFNSIDAVNTGNFDTYFDVLVSNSDQIRLTLTDVGYGLFFKNFTNFFKDVDGFVWDASSLEYLIEDFTIDFTTLGEPTNMSLTKTKKDKFGGYKQNISSSIEHLSEVSGLKPYVSSLYETSKNKLNSIIETAMNSISSGNFTHRIEIKGTMYEYNNYYSFTGDTTDLPHMMISDLIMDDASSGETFITVIEENDGTLKPYGFSPRAETYGTLTDITFANYQELIPDLRKLSVDFFDVQLESDVMGYFYKFDISKFTQFDYYFANDLLRVLFGGFDPVVIYGGFFVNYAIYDYTFNYLTIESTTNGFAYTLNFTNEYGDFNAVCSFKNINTTDITNVDRIKSGVEYIKDVYLGGN